MQYVNPVYKLRQKRPRRSIRGFRDTKNRRRKASVDAMSDKRIMQRFERTWRQIRSSC